MGNLKPAKQRDYSTYMAKKMTDAAIQMDTKLFVKWLTLVMTRRAEAGDEWAQGQLADAS